MNDIKKELNKLDKNINTRASIKGYSTFLASMRYSLIFTLMIICFSLHSEVLGQILPPSYNPLPPETLKEYKDKADELKQQLDANRENKRVLEYNISRLKQTNLNDSSIAENLKNESKNYQKEMLRLVVYNTMDSVLIQEIKGKIRQFETDSLIYAFKMDSIRNQILMMNSKRSALLCSIKQDSSEFRKLLDTLVLKPDHFEVIDEINYYEKNIKKDSITHNNDSNNIALMNLKKNNSKIVFIDSLFKKDIKNYQGLINKDSLIIAKNTKIVKLLQCDIDSLYNSIQKKNIEINRNKAGSEQNLNWSQQIFKGSEQRDSVIVNLEAELVKVKCKIDSLKDEYKEKNDISNGYASIATRVFLPVKDEDDAEKFYGEPDLLDHITFNIETKSMSIEGFTGYLGQFRFGGSINTKLSPNGKNKAKDNLTDFYTSGGDLVLYSEYPLLYKVNKSFSLTVQTLFKTGVSNIFGSAKYNFDPGVEVFGKLSLNSFISFFAFYRQGFAVGFNNFYKDIGYSKDVPFTYGQVVAGIELWKFKISLSGVPFGNKELTMPTKFTSIVIESPLPK